VSRRPGLVGATALCAALIGCAVPGSGPGDVTSTSSPPIEHRAMLSNPNSRGIVQVEPLETYLNGVMQRILDTVEAPQRPRVRIRVYVSATDDVGADCFVDGAIYIRWKTFVFLKSEDAIAALLAHEVSHIILGHLSNDGWTSLLKPLSAIATVASLGAPGAVLTTVIGGQYVDKAGLAAWSRNQEIAADTQGLALMAKAGYDPDAYFDLFDAIGEYRLPVETPGLLSNFKPTGKPGEYQINIGNLQFGSVENSHPELPARKANMRKLLDASNFARGGHAPRPANAYPSILSLAVVKASLSGLEAEAEGDRLFRGGSFPGALRNVHLALASPVADSIVVQVLRINVLHRALPAQSFSSHLGALATRADAPIWLSILELSIASSARDWKSAAGIADFIQERYEPLPVLYPMIMTAYEKRTQQLTGLLPKIGNIPVSGPGREAEFKEYSRLTSVTLKLTLKCVATGDLNIMAGCSHAK
jgi:Zn-dependent protease with chaperone function